MAENPHADGLAEDLIRAFVQVACAESHLKTLLEKSISELENGLIEVEKPGVIDAHTEKISEITEEINHHANIRRRMMLKLYEMYHGDKSYWCVVKHLGTAAYTAWEVYQASDDDPDYLDIAMETNKRFIKALSRFLGMEIVECAACFADLLKAKKGDA